MKKNKVLKIVLIVLGTLVALLAAAVLGVLLYLRGMAASLPETLPDAPVDSTQFTLTDDDLDKLLSGEITLEELTGEAAASSGGEQEAAASAPQEEAGSAASSGSSGSQTESSNASSSGKKENTTGTSGSSTASAAEKPASSSGKQEAAYETEVKALLKQLYSVKARAESELNSCIAGAKAEYKALPESQQTQARKISIALARSGRLYAMQASYDKEVENIVSQMRTVLTANGQSTALADQAMASYKAQKSAMYSQLTRTICSPLSVQKAVSPPLSHPSIRVLFFSISQAKPPAAPLSGTVNARKKVLRVVIGRFAGQEYNFAVSWEYRLYVSTEQLPERTKK